MKRRESTNALAARRSPRRRILIGLVAASLVALLAPQAQGSGGSFHVGCAFSHALPDDPIVHPGDPGASHMHDFFGNDSTNAASTLKSMKASSSSCNVQGDRSGYWVPELLAPNGDAVTPKSASIYYRAAGAKVVVFPPDFRMIAGGDTSDLKVSGYSCNDDEPHTSEPTDCTKGELKGIIVFPSCWDGVHTDSADHRSHMAYPLRYSRCPADHPVNVPKIVLVVQYNIHDAQGDYLSSDAMMGMSNGMSLHADFWNVWDQTALQTLVTNCLNQGQVCPSKS